MNRSLNASFVIPSAYIGFRLFLLLGKRLFVLPKSLGGNTGLVFPSRTSLLAPNLARPRQALPPGAQTRPVPDMLCMKKVYKEK